MFSILKLVPPVKLMITEHQKTLSYFLKFKFDKQQTLVQGQYSKRTV